MNLKTINKEDCIWGFNKDYYFLSNFYNHNITYNGLTFKNVEAAFHAQKCPLRAAEFTALSPAMAKRLGRSVDLRPDWESIKLNIMTELLKIKFSDPILKDKLLATGNKILVEANWWHDDFWGYCSERGQNNLGKLLMMIRDNKI